MKRTGSPDDLPPAKRSNDEGRPRRHDLVPINFDSLYDELVLVIFSYLSSSDLCTIQPTNKHWSRLSSDNQLWKRLYLHEHSRLRGSRGFLGREDGREVKPLPSRAHAEDVIDWKWMYRISSNWRKGRCAKHHLYDSSHSSFVKSDLAVDNPSVKTHIVLSGSYTFISSGDRVFSPAIFVHRLGSLHPHRLLGIHETDAETSITNICFDQSPPGPAISELRIATFYDTGEFTVFAMSSNHWPRSRILHSYCPAHKTDRTTPIITAVYRHPLLVTLSQSFHLSLYNLSTQRVVHTQTLSSFTSFPPTSLVLTGPSLSSYKLVLAYSMPVYPNHWSAASTELLISLPRASTSNASCTVTGTRTIRAFDVAPGWMDMSKLEAVREQWERKVGRVADIRSDGKWVVLAPGDSSIPGLQLYRLHFPPLRSHLTPRLTFVRSLHGHTGPIDSLCVSDGRCVSLGSDGSLWIWDLEQDWSAEVQSACKAVNTGRPSGTVVFDDRTIVTSDSSGIEVRRFDI